MNILSDPKLQLATDITSVSCFYALGQFASRTRRPMDVLEFEDRAHHVRNSLDKSKAQSGAKGCSQLTALKNAELVKLKSCREHQEYCDS